MNASSHIAFQRFTIDVEFSSGGEPYATQTYEVEAADWFLAEREALEMSVNSTYDNARIPDLTRRAIAR